MMKHQRNVLTITLVVISLALLLLLQGFWLKGAYHNELASLRKQSQILFRDLIFEMNDSLLQKSISTIPRQSSLAIIENGDSSKFAKRFGTSMKLMGKDTSVNMQVFIYSDGIKDSIKDVLKPFINKISGQVPQTLSIQLRRDSLKVDAIERKFRIVLDEAGIYVPFHIKSIKREFGFPPKPPKDEQVVFSHNTGFKADFTEMNWFIVKRMSPQILFSIFLTALTVISFWVMFRNIRSQQRLAELKNDFISNMTHELKTPVTTVGVALEALKNFNGLENPQLTQEYLAIAQNELNRLSILTDKILKTSIFENGGVQFESENLDLEKIVEQTVQSLKLVFEKAKATVEIKKEGTYFNLKGGAVHITNVVYNLLDNALKYSKENPAIVVSLRENSREVTLSVQDNGVGIPAEFKKRIFEKFFRVPTGDVHTVKGYGLGLSYVDAVVRAHNGVIEIESELGKGSCFIIRFKR